MTVSFYTLGCKLNFAETSTIGRLFAESGYTKTDFGLPADVVVINTCTVTAQADRKCRQVISRAVTSSPGAIVVVMGCFAGLKASDISRIPGVGLVLDNSQKFHVIEHINRLRAGNAEATAPLCSCGTDHPFFAAFSIAERTRSFLKVQDGCDYRCTYCTVPAVRGRSRNASITDIVRQAQAIADRGIGEIVLTGVNIGDFGKTTGETFLQLLRALDSIPVERIRIGSVEPNLLSEDVIMLIAGSQKLAPHFHIPLQSGSNRILGLMARRYRCELFAEKVALIHKHIPCAAIGADVIVGFPGETDIDFEETRSFIESLDIASLHVFTYSERPGTPSVSLPCKVKPAEAAQRSKALIAISEAKRTHFYRKHTGQRLRVLFEQRAKGGLMTGFTDNYIRVEIPWNAQLIGKCIPVELTGISASGNMMGTVCGTEQENHVSIRPIHPSEHSIMEKLLYEAIFQPEGALPYPRSIIQKPEIAVYTKEFGTLQHDHCLVAELNGAIVGGVWARVLDGDVRTFGFIDHETPELAISLFKPYRNRGIGSRLMRSMLDYLKERGYERASLSVEKENYAVKMYQHLGFQTIRENSCDYIMSISLNTL